MKHILFIVALLFCLPNLTIHTQNLQALETERELHRLVKIKLHGEPLKLATQQNDSLKKMIAFSPDGKHLAVAFNPGNVVIYDIAAEKAKRFDAEMDKLRQEMKVNVVQMNKRQ